MKNRTGQAIQEIQEKLHSHFGPLNWWPANSAFEVAIGAILTQNTAWANVERAIANLKRASALSVARLARLPISQIEEQIRPAGFFRQKALRLQTLARLLEEDWHSDLLNLCGGPLDEARARLLTVSGIGPETADSILLYAAQRPSFVVDAYTRRIFGRIGLLHGKEPYDEIRRMFMDNLPESAAIYNDYHAQIVHLAKTFCRKSRTFCSACPLREACLHASQDGSALSGSPE